MAGVFMLINVVFMGIMVIMMNIEASDVRRTNEETETSGGLNATMETRGLRGTSGLVGADGMNKSIETEKSLIMTTISSEFGSQEQSVTGNAFLVNREYTYYNESFLIPTLSSATFEGISTATVAPSLLINKCCKFNENLDSLQTSCVAVQNSTLPYHVEEESVAALRERGQRVRWLNSAGRDAMSRAREDAVIRYGRRPCGSELTAVIGTVGARLHPNGSLEVRGILKFSGDPDKNKSVLISPEDYCADKAYLGKPPKPYYVYLACPCTGSTTCIRKCCYYSKTMTVLSETAMQQFTDCSLSSKQKWNATLKDDSDGWGSSDGKYALLGGPFPEPCTSGRMKISLDSRDHNAGLVLLSNGSLITKGELGSPFLPQEYCVDQAVSPDGVESLWAIVCAKRPLQKSMGNLDTSYVILYMVGMVTLIATLVVYSLVPTLRRPVNAKAFMCHVASLAAAQLVLCTSHFVTQVHSFTPCATLGFSAQFFLLAAFCWLSVLCFDIARGFSSAFRPIDISVAAASRRFLCYSLFAWGVPAVMLAVTLALTYSRDLPLGVLRPGLGKRNCWFNGIMPQFAYYNGPVAILLLVNLAMFFFTLARLRIAQRGMDNLKNENVRLKGGALRTRRDRFVLFVKLFSLMGVTWALEAVAWALQADWVTSLALSAVNMLRGVGVFVACCCKREVLNALKARWSRSDNGRALGRNRVNGLSYTTNNTVTSNC